MAEIQITNGATVNRIWSDCNEAELLAAFQYETDAVEFAERKLAEDVARDWLGTTYIISNHYSGKVRAVRHKAEQVPA